MKKFSKAIAGWGLMLLLAAFVFVGCGEDKNNKAEVDKNNNIKTERKKIYTSFYPMYDFAKKIAGDKLEIVNIVPVGSEPHDYELTTQNRKDLSKADLLIYSGLGMESWVDDLKGSLKDNKLTFVEASKGIVALEHDHDEKDEEHEHDHDKKDEEHEHDHDEKDEEHEHDHDKKDEEHDHDKKDEDHDHDHGKYDPHVWLSPLNALKQLENIKDALIKLDSDNKDFFNANYERYAKELKELDASYKKELAPYKDKHIVVNHEAFGYICEAYGIEQKGISGLSPENEPSPNKMSEIVKFVKENNVKVIYFEEIASPKVSEAIAKEAGVKTLQLNTLEGLNDEEIKKGSDYISVMKENLANLIKGFK